MCSVEGELDPICGFFRKLLRKKIIWRRLRCMALLADFPPASQITWLEAGVLGNSRQHSGTNLLAIMKSKNVVRIICVFKRLVRS